VDCGRICRAQTCAHSGIEPSTLAKGFLQDGPKVRQKIEFLTISSLYVPYISVTAKIEAHKQRMQLFISPYSVAYSVAFGVILSLLFFVCTVEDISTQDGAIGVKFWLRVEQIPGTGTR